MLGNATFVDGEWKGSVEGILDYYFRTRGGARPLNEAKLILLGWGGVGKTSLVKRLVHGSFDPSEERTEGIEVTSWPVNLAKDPFELDETDLRQRFPNIRVFVRTDCAEVNTASACKTW